MKYQDSQMDISKLELIAQLKGLIGEAQNTPLTELCRAGDYQNQPELRYPQTKGEYIAGSISTLLASQSWIDGKAEPLLDDFLNVVFQLDKDVNQPDAWRELLDLAKKV